MSDNLSRILPPRSPIAIIRLDDLRHSHRILSALKAGGLRHVEFTLTSPGAIQAIASARREFGSEMVIGAGTVLTPEDARACVDAGAQFLITPALVKDVIFEANASGVPIACGAFSPTEMLDAHRSGAEMVKLFPATRLGAGFIKDVLAPLPFLKIIPTGGVTVENTPEFLAAGAYSVAVGSSLISRAAVEAEDWDGIAKTAAAFVKACL